MRSAFRVAQTLSLACGLLLLAGCHRGPDLKPRLFAPSIYLMAFTDEGELALPPASRRSGAQKRKRARAKHAMALNVAASLQGIAPDAAEGDKEARAQMLRMLRDMHDMLQPMPHEAAKGGQGPILPKFNRPAQSAQPAPPRSSSSAAMEQPPASITGPDGEEYVEGPPPEGAR